MERLGDSHTPKAVCPPYCLNTLSSIRPPYLKQWGEQPLSAFIAWLMTIIMMHICMSWVCSEWLQWCKPQQLIPHWWIWHPAWHLEAGSIYQEQTTMWKVQLWKRNLPAEDPWHNWHMPEEASGTKVAAVTQWGGQQHLLCQSASAVMAEPHQANPVSLVVTSRWGLWEQS